MYFMLNEVSYVCSRALDNTQHWNAEAQPSSVIKQIQTAGSPALLPTSPEHDVKKRCGSTNTTGTG
eukprot:10577569-Prorocentrum_lima.AAC.1